MVKKSINKMFKDKQFGGIDVRKYGVAGKNGLAF